MITHDDSMCGATFYGSSHCCGVRANDMVCMANRKTRQVRRFCALLFVPCQTDPCHVRLRFTYFEPSSCVGDAAGAVGLPWTTERAWSCTMLSCHVANALRPAAARVAGAAAPIAPRAMATVMSTTWAAAGGVTHPRGRWTPSLAQQRYVCGCRQSLAPATLVWVCCPTYPRAARRVAAAVAPGLAPATAAVWCWNAHFAPPHTVPPAVCVLLLPRCVPRHMSSSSGHSSDESSSSSRLRRKRSARPVRSRREGESRAPSRDAGSGSMPAAEVATYDSTHWPRLADPHTVSIIGSPMQYGQGLDGTEAAPGAFRDAGLMKKISSLGWRVRDRGTQAAMPFTRPGGADRYASSTHRRCRHRKSIAERPSRQGCAAAFLRKYVLWWRCLLASELRPPDCAPPCTQSVSRMSACTTPRSSRRRMATSRSPSAATTALRLAPWRAYTAILYFSGIAETPHAAAVLGACRGALRARPNLGVLWVDAHADINAPEFSPSANAHGMPVAFLTKLIECVCCACLCWPTWWLTGLAVFYQRG